MVAINNQQVVGQISINQSDTTNHLITTFFDINNVHFQPSSPPHTLMVKVADASVIAITGQDVAEPWAF